MNKLTLEGLEESIRYQMQRWNNEGVTILNSTVLAEVLSEGDGFEPAVSSAKLFPPTMNWIVWANGGKQFEWPANLLTMTVTELAEYIMQKQNNEEISGIVSDDF